MTATVLIAEAAVLAMSGGHVQIEVVGHHQTELFAKKRWRPILFREAAFRQAVQREYKVEGAR